VKKPAKAKEYDITKTAGYREAMDDVNRFGIVILGTKVRLSE
jgi:hypothetical protein